MINCKWCNKRGEKAGMIKVPESDDYICHICGSLIARYKLDWRMILENENNTRIC